MIHASGCICGKHLFELVNEGICVWCGHGIPRAVAETAYRREVQCNRTPTPAVVIRMPRLDLAAARAIATPTHGGRRWYEGRIAV